jgi:hypothetical protein
LANKKQELPVVAMSGNVLTLGQKKKVKIKNAL